MSIHHPTTYSRFLPTLRCAAPARLLAAALALLAGAASAAPVPSSVSTAPGMTHNAAALTGFSTTGSDMAGIRVTAYFSNSTSQTAIWSDQGGGYGGAFGAGWGLTLDGDSFTSPWTLYNDANALMVRLVVDGKLGRTAFDMISDPELSPGSARGKAFTDADLDGAGVRFVDVLYLDRLVVGGVFYEDLYTRMDLRFEGDGLLGQLTFLADTDNASVDIRPGIPEPSTYALLGLGLAGVGWVARRRRMDCGR
ncbi:MAG: PEP-CTERM sorting domain-containing protein [Aquabacterium sp.]